MTIITSSSLSRYLNALIYRNPGMLGGFKFRMRGIPKLSGATAIVITPITQEITTYLALQPGHHIS
jgi:hypothetical protein